MKRWPSVILLVGLLSTLLAVPLTSYAQVPGPGQGQGQGRQTAPGQNKGNTFPVTGTGTAKPASGIATDATFAGEFVVSRFEVASSGALQAVGRLSGKVTTAAGDTAVPDTDVTVPVQTINGKALPSAATTSDAAADVGDMQIAQIASCDILNLVLGPLHLDLLGLVVDLNQVLLNITGQTGAGNLLGNLLCAVTGLLDTTGTLAVIANLLNAILQVLNLP